MTTLVLRAMWNPFFLLKSAHPPVLFSSNSKREKPRESNGATCESLADGLLQTQTKAMVGVSEPLDIMENVPSMETTSIDSEEPRF